MTGNRIGLSLTASLLLLMACGGQPGTAAPRDRNVISREQIQVAGSGDAYSIVLSLRPQWLEPRGVSTISLRESVKVYLDGSLLGGPDHLRRIDVQSVDSIRYMDALEATQRWGLDHGHGAILVATRRQIGRD